MVASPLASDRNTPLPTPTAANNTNSDRSPNRNPAGFPGCPSAVLLDNRRLCSSITPHHTALAPQPNQSNESHLLPLSPLPRLACPDLSVSADTAPRPRRRRRPHQRPAPLVERQPPHPHPLVRRRRFPRNGRRMVSHSRLQL